MEDDQETRKHVQYSRVFPSCTEKPKVHIVTADKKINVERSKGRRIMYWLKKLGRCFGYNTICLLR